MKNATSRPTTLVLAAAWLYRGKLPPPQSTDTTLQSSTSYIPDIFIPLSYPSLLYPLPLPPSPPQSTDTKLQSSTSHIQDIFIPPPFTTLLYPLLPSLVSIPFQVSMHPIASYPPPSLLESLYLPPHKSLLPPPLSLTK